MRAERSNLVFRKCLISWDCFVATLLARTCGWTFYEAINIKLTEKGPFRYFVCNIPLQLNEENTAEKCCLNNRVKKRWEVCSFDGFDDSSLKELGISPLTAQILSNRGISNLDQAKRFLSPALSDLPDPFTMKNIDQAVARIEKAVRHQEKITIFGDYDVDGATATAVLLLFLKSLGASVDFYIPHRLQEGYGLNIEAVKKIQAEGAKLLITADCGISNPEEVRWAVGRGMDVIVSDHHEIPETLPPALAILNPKQKDCPYPFKELAGVGVAFNLVIALRSRLRQNGTWQGLTVPNLKEYLDLVALGTVADVVPLIGVNRILVQFGLIQLARSTRPGISALKEISKMGEMPLDTTGINFRLSPRINAAGRMEDAGQAVRLLTADDERETRLIAAHLDHLNSLRQRLEEKILIDARKMIESPSGISTTKSLVLASLDWHPGVIGIVASRLAEEYYRPTILIALKENLGKGSGRSIGPFPLYQGLKACQNLVERFGGHAQAAGLVIRPECIPDFSKAFEEVVHSLLTEEDFIPRLSIDTFTKLDQMNESFLSELDSLSPFGIGNPEPVLAVADLTVLDSQLVGKNHMRLRLKEGRGTRSAIGFQMASWHPMAGEHMQMAFSPQVGFFQGKKTLQLKIIDLKPAG
ncbi:MAG: single-stranded-DNA-specific exonuclease RecJ [Deltaproteobacteria bacterium]|nr:single-stranded-DNA-specific exonuclease RecJ [Deltaproteobacteria bacterium]